VRRNGATLESGSSVRGKRRSIDLVVTLVPSFKRKDRKGKKGRGRSRGGSGNNGKRDPQSRARKEEGNRTKTS